MTHICKAISDGHMYIMQLFENMPDKAILKKVFVYCTPTLYFWLGRRVERKKSYYFFFRENGDFLMKMGQKSSIFQKSKKKKKKKKKKKDRFW